jgi:hypothetical protein
MARLGTSILGGIVGFAVTGGNPLGAQAGFALGSVAGGILFAPSGPKQQGPRLSELGTMAAAEGAPLPILYGAQKINGVAIWTNGIDETSKTEDVGGKGGSPGGSSTTYSYSASFAVSFCEGPVTGFRRIWADTKLIYDNREDAAFAAPQPGESIGFRFLQSQTHAEEIRFYKGDFAQIRDPLIESIEGTDETPAFRGTAYIVFEDLQLADFGNRIPTIRAEVVKGGTIAPPIRIITFDALIPTHHITYDNGIFTRSTYSAGPTSITSTHTAYTHDLGGRLIGTKRFVGNRTDSQSAISIDEVKNQWQLNHMYASTGNVASRSSWWLFGLGARPAGTNLHPSPPVSSWASKPSLGDNFKYYRDLLGGKATFFGGYVFGFAHENQNDLGIARYPLGPSEEVPSGEPDAFWDATGFMDESAVEFLNLSNGDDGRLYATHGSVDGAAAFLVDADILVFDLDLNLLRQIKIDGSMQGGSDVAVWQEKLVFAIRDGGAGLGAMALHDISAAAIAANGGLAPLLGTQQHAMIDSNQNISGIGGGLWISDDGVWSMNEQILLDDPTLRSVVEDICQRDGLALGQIDALDLTPTVRGYLVNSPMPGKNAIEPLTTGFSFDAFESEAKIKFRLRGGSAVATIPEADLGNYVSSPPPSFSSRDHTQALELPAEIAVAYSSLREDYEQAVQPSKRIVTTTQNMEIVTLPIVLTSQEAARIADRLMQELWIEQNSFQFVLTRKYDRLELADAVSIPGANGNVHVRIVAITRGSDGVIEYSAVEDISRLYSSTALGNDEALEDDQVFAIKGPTKLHVIDSPLFRGSDDSPGFYVAVSGFYNAYSGGLISKGLPGAEQFPVATLTKVSTAGGLTNILGDSDFRGVDYYNSINVFVSSTSTLSSITDAALIAGGNQALVGGEVIQFGIATLEIDGSYTLRNLMRGNFGTYSEGHADTEDFLYLDSSKIVPIDGSLTDQGVLFDFNSISIADPNATPSSLNVTLVNGRIRPYPPVHAFAAPIKNGDIKGRFQGQARLNGEWRDGVEAKSDETVESYEVDVLSDDLLTVVRTIAVDNSKLFTYDAASQLADHGEYLGAYSFNVSQISDRVNRGKATAFVSKIGSGAYDYETEILADSPFYYFPLDSADDFRERITRKALDQTVGGFSHVNSTPIYGYKGSHKKLIQAEYRYEYPDEINTQYTDQLTVEFWWKIPAGATRNRFSWTSRATQGGASSNNVFEMVQADNSTTVISPQAVFWFVGVSAEFVKSTAPAYNDTGWHHFVGQIDNAIAGSHIMRLYIDGVLNNTKAITLVADGVALNTSTLDLRMYRGDGLYATTYSGYACHFAYYNSILSPTQILDHYNLAGI